MMKKVRTFNEYMNDPERVTQEEKQEIEFTVTLMGKMIEAREKRGMSQRELAAISGVKQPAIARLETLKSIPKVDTLFKLLSALDLTIEIVPIKK